MKTTCKVDSKIVVGSLLKIISTGLRIKFEFSKHEIKLLLLIHFFFFVFWGFFKIYEIYRI